VFTSKVASCRGPQVRNWDADCWVAGSNPGLYLGCMSSGIVPVPTTGWPSLASPLHTKVAYSNIHFIYKQVQQKHVLKYWWMFTYNLEIWTLHFRKSFLLFEFRIPRAVVCNKYQLHNVIMSGCFLKNSWWTIYRPSTVNTIRINPNPIISNDVLPYKTKFVITCSLETYKR
jgi:hypothetical protein